MFAKDTVLVETDHKCSSRSLWGSRYHVYYQLLRDFSACHKDYEVLTLKSHTSVKPSSTQGWHTVTSAIKTRPRRSVLWRDSLLWRTWGSAPSRRDKGQGTTLDWIDAIYEDNEEVREWKRVIMEVWPNTWSKTPEKLGAFLITELSWL